MWVIIMAVVCTIALMLPLESEEHSDLPHYLLLSVNQKLLAAFILGTLVEPFLNICIMVNLSDHSCSSKEKYTCTYHWRKD